jgi:predicted DNA-binding transcriptional regulator AlpA
MSGLTPILLDYDGAAAVLSLSRPALRDLVYRNRGPRCVRIGRRTMFAMADLQEFVDRHRMPAQPSAVAAPPPKRKRGRPTILETMAREAAGSV